MPETVRRRTRVAVGVYVGGVAWLCGVGCSMKRRRKEGREGVKEKG